MGLRTAATVLSTIAGLGGSAGTGAYFLSSAAPSTTAMTAAPTAAGAAGSGASTAASTSSAPHCADGAWRGPDDVNINGRPDSFDAGDNGAAYIWHDSDGWHLRTTDISKDAHHYSGTIAASRGASFLDIRPVQLEKDDRVWVTGDNVLHYSFTTHGGIDGVDFKVSACDGARDHETLRFSLDYNGREMDTARIKLGDHKQHPEHAAFEVFRATTN